MKLDHEFIYKLLTKEQWALVKNNQLEAPFCGALDKQDGYIHLSTARQAEYIAKKYFKNDLDITVLKIALFKIKDLVKWEPSSKQELFPHAYGIIPFDAIVKVYDVNIVKFDWSTLK